MLMPLPSSYRLSLPTDTILECLLYPAQLLIIDVWSLPSTPSAFPTHRTLWLHRSPLTQRLAQAALLLEALRLDGERGTVRVAEVKEWGDELTMRDGEDDVLFMREEASRPCAMRWWDGLEGGMSRRDMEDLIEGVVEERLREEQRAVEKKAQKEAREPQGTAQTDTSRDK